MTNALIEQFSIGDERRMVCLTRHLEGSWVLKSMGCEFSIPLMENGEWVDIWGPYPLGDTMIVSEAQAQAVWQILLECGLEVVQFGWASWYDGEAEALFPRHPSVEDWAEAEAWEACRPEASSRDTPVLERLRLMDSPGGDPLGFVELQPISGLMMVWIERPSRHPKSRMIESVLRRVGGVDARNPKNPAPSGRPACFRFHGDHEGDRAWEALEVVLQLTFEPLVEL